MQPIADETEEKRAELIETLADLDDDIAELYLCDEELDATFLKRALRRATLDQDVVPVFMGTALRNTGVQPLLDGVEDYLPDPCEVMLTLSLYINTLRNFCLRDHLPILFFLLSGQ